SPTGGRTVAGGYTWPTKGDWRSWLARQYNTLEVTGSSPVSPTTQRTAALTGVAVLSRSPHPPAEDHHVTTVATPQGHTVGAPPPPPGVPPPSSAPVLAPAPSTRG